MDSTATEIEGHLNRAVAAVQEGDLQRAFNEYEGTIRLAKPKLCVIGDSHVWGFSADVAMRPVWLGAVTMHRLGRDGISLLDLTKLSIRPNMGVIFSFGEIDARQHISVQAERQRRSYQVIAAELVDRYLDAIGTITARWPRDRVLIATTLPPHAIPPTSKHAFVNAPELAKRIEGARVLNATLQSACLSRDFRIVDVYGLFKDEADTLPDIFTEDDIHIYTPAGRDRLARYLNSYLPF